ncbi:MAG: hypothetical protein M3Q48_11250 [Actinomycetota bacterium]|nr:hypothetical protein [Actinomycetota bacterium]HSH23756.1 hypothetical protein [Acidimicrobiales bacterium]
MRRFRRRVLPLAATALAVAALAGPAGASHSWGNYHWARTSNPFELKLGDNVHSEWDSYLGTASTHWSTSEVLDTAIVAGGVGNLKRCPPTAGRVEVCTTAYGRNGWLGLASVWASSDGHITQATVKLNDTYFTKAYNTASWRASVMCQEIGHTLGLGHDDEDFATHNGTCMDYSNTPEGNERPGAHDYEQLEAIYGAHDDGTTTLASSPGAAAGAGGGNSQAEWGRAIRYDAGGRPSLFERDLGNGQKVFTFVTWAR